MSRRQDVTFLCQRMNGIKEQIKEQARGSIQAKLKEKQKQVMEYEKKQDVHIRKKNMEL